VRGTVLATGDPDTTIRQHRGSMTVPHRDHPWQPREAAGTCIVHAGTSPRTSQITGTLSTAPPSSVSERNSRVKRVSRI